MNANTQQDPVPYELLGGGAGVRRLVDRFYALMDTVPEYHGIRKLHPEDLSGSAEKLYLFLSGWLGRPAALRRKARPPDAAGQAPALPDRHCRT